MNWQASLVWFVLSAIIFGASIYAIVRQRRGKDIQSKK